jgi:hypothetical protein
MERTITNQLIDNYYEELSKVRIELTNRIKEIVKEDVIIYDVSEGIDDEYYELPIFYTVNKYSQYDTYSIVKITKDLEVIGNSWEEGDIYTQDISEISLDSLYDLYLELTKGN